MKLKKGVNPAGLRPELLLALIVASEVYKKHGFELVVTSLNDSKHSYTSLHFSGAAADLRIWGMTNPDLVVDGIKEALGDSPHYDVILESDHIHMEYQPKYEG